MDSTFCTPCTWQLVSLLRKKIDSINKHSFHSGWFLLTYLQSSGGAGLILLVTLFSDGYILSGVFTLLATICWLVLGAMAIFLYKKTYDQYKAAGHTFKEAKDDAYTQLGRSPTARNMAGAAAGAYVRTGR